ncbi:helix-turn-helix domain-containing protein [Companilactobacillus furfuricola]|uniref:helix-turn-helix domain-containing protein n=1 Tax=Companilactobacillus furfuricola TaxID=1462575 RepID=UPI000F767E3D|nr:helix-turn-helix transcriptional regulator [Companilactobacillus furfuricola]
MKNNKLALLRKQTLLSQSQVADALNISRQSVSYWENSRSFPDSDKLIDLANIYNVSIVELLDSMKSTF